jgi:glycine cleavage system aminomethyltransferase T
MTDGNPEYDAHGTDIARFYPHQRSKEHVAARTSEGFNKTYGIVHPSEQWNSNRNVRLAPMHASERDLGAEFFEVAGWERPHWYASNEALLGEYGDAVMPREAEWDSRWWSPIINAEHLAMRERAGYVDLSAFVVFDVVGRGAFGAVQRIAVGQMNVAPGKVVYTPIIDERGGFRADLTIMRLAEDRFRVVTGGAHGNLDRKWFSDRMPADGSAVVVDLTSAFTTIGLWGPRARDILGSLTESDISHSAFGFGTCQNLELGSLSVLASRISYVGELGWELHVPMEQGARLWDLVRAAGQPHGAVPVGIGVYGTTGRIEKGYRAFGAELDSERTIVEAGMMRPKVKDADFVGREAYLKQRDNEPESILCTVTVDDHTSADGTKRYMLGGEPIVTRDGEALVDGHGHRAYVTSAGSAPSIGKHVLMAYLPPDAAVLGNQLAVDYFEERYPVTVAAADATPLFDPDNSRVRS